MYRRQNKLARFFSLAKVCLAVILTFFIWTIFINYFNFKVSNISHKSIISSKGYSFCWLQRFWKDFKEIAEFPTFSFEIQTRQLNRQPTSTINTVCFYWLTRKWTSVERHSKICGILTDLWIREMAEEKKDIAEKLSADRLKKYLLPTWKKENERVLKAPHRIEVAKQTSLWKWKKRLRKKEKEIT